MAGVGGQSGQGGQNPLDALFSTSGATSQTAANSNGSSDDHHQLCRRIERGDDHGPELIDRLDQFHDRDRHERV